MGIIIRDDILQARIISKLSLAHPDCPPEMKVLIKESLGYIDEVEKLADKLDSVSVRMREAMGFEENETP